jgi:hypothetical protein
VAFSRTTRSSALNAGVDSIRHIPHIGMIVPCETILLPTPVVTHQRERVMEYAVFRGWFDNDQTFVGYANQRVVIYRAMTLSPSFLEVSFRATHTEPSVIIRDSVNFFMRILDESNRINLPFVPNVPNFRFNGWIQGDHRCDPLRPCVVTSAHLSNGARVVIDRNVNRYRFTACFTRF